MHKSFNQWVCRVALAFAFVFGLVPMSAWAQEYPTESEPGDQPSYPGIPPSHGKLEGAFESYNLRVYGTMLLNLSASDTPTVGGEVALWATPGNARTTFVDGTSKRVHDG